MSKLILRLFAGLYIFMTLFTLEASQKANPIPKKNKAPVYNYERNPHVPPDVWARVSPYFLPSNHPIKEKLDQIFSEFRVSLNKEMMRIAGFEQPEHRQFSGAIVSQHPLLRGYYVKVYTDDREGVNEWHQWLIRIEGANNIQATIDKYKLNKLFKVPKKWIYPLPAEPSPPRDYLRKNFILVVENMRTLTYEDNFVKWRSRSMTQDRANALFLIMKENGLNDCIHPFNVPFCRDGKQAFVDTENHHKWPIHFEIMLDYFSPQIADHWRRLIVNGVS